jgi:hypothetical protein
MLRCVVKCPLVRFVAVLGVPAVLLLAGAIYFFAKPNSEQARIAAVLERAEKADAPPLDADDAVDTALVRQMLATKKLTDEQTTTLISAAGRRYIRRKQALAAAQTSLEAGKGDSRAVDALQREVDTARKVCDVAESFGHSRDLLADASLEAQLERILAGGSGIGFGLTDRFSGINNFSEADLRQLQNAFGAQFGRPLPISAHGETASHRALGFDHRGRIDVAVSPLQPEGAWLRSYLKGKGVTYFAFSSAVRGKATGAHIHIGPPSGRVGAAAPSVRSE